MMAEAQTVLDFWFKELTPAQWFDKDADLDQRIANKFSALHSCAVAGELQDWRETVHGRLAEIIVLDQFSRNIYRDTPKAFAADGMAVVLAQEAVHAGALEALGNPERQFILMPFMHSESAKVHERTLELWSMFGLDATWEHKHKAIVDRFGRYPHRNAILGRPSSAEEVAFLQEPGSSF